HKVLQCTCPLLTQSGHSKIIGTYLKLSILTAQRVTWDGVVENVFASRANGAASPDRSPAKWSPAVPICVNNSVVAPRRSTIYFSTKWPRARCSVSFDGRRQTLNLFLMRLSRASRV